MVFESDNPQMNTKFMEFRSNTVYNEKRFQQLYAEYGRRLQNNDIRHPQLAKKYTGYTPSLLVLKKAFADAGHEWIESRTNLCSEIIDNFFINSEFDNQSVADGIKCFKFAIDNGYPYHYNSSIDNTRKYHKVYTIDVFGDIVIILIMLIYYHETNQITMRDMVRDFMEYYLNISGESLFDKMLISCILANTIFDNPAAFADTKIIKKSKYYLNTFMDFGFNFNYIYYDVMLAKCSPRSDIYTNAFQLGIDFTFRMLQSHFVVLNYSFTPIINNRIYELVHQVYLIDKILRDNYKQYGHDGHTDIEFSDFLPICNEHEMNKAFFQHGRINGIKRLVIDHIKNAYMGVQLIKAVVNNPEFEKKIIGEIRNHKRMIDTLIGCNDASRDIRREYYNMMISIMSLNVNVKICNENEYIYKNMRCKLNIGNSDDWEKYRSQMIVSCRTKLNVIMRNTCNVCSYITTTNIYNLYDIIASYW